MTYMQYGKCDWLSDGNQRKQNLYNGKQADIVNL